VHRPSTRDERLYPKTVVAVPKHAASGTTAQTPVRLIEATDALDFARQLLGPAEPVCPYCEGTGRQPLSRRGVAMVIFGYGSVAWKSLPDRFNGITMGTLTTLAAKLGRTIDETWLGLQQIAELIRDEGTD